MGGGCAVRCDEAVAEVQGQDGFGVSVPVAAWWLVHGGTSPPLSRNITAFQPGVGAADETVIAGVVSSLHRTPCMGYTCLSLVHALWKLISQVVGALVHSGDDKPI